MLLGYARVSTLTQDPTSQVERLAALGIDRDRIYVDRGVRGESLDRPELRTLLAACRDGDVVAVTDLDRLTRSVEGALALVEALAERGTSLRLGSMTLDLRDPRGRHYVLILAANAELEASLIRAHTRDGMAVTRARGHLKGRRSRIQPARQRYVVELWQSGEGASAIAELMGIPRTTVRRIIEKHQATKTSGPSTVVDVTGG